MLDSCSSERERVDFTQSIYSLTLAVTLVCRPPPVVARTEAISAFRIFEAAVDDLGVGGEGDAVQIDDVAVDDEPDVAGLVRGIPDADAGFHFSEEFVRAAEEGDGLVLVTDFEEAGPGGFEVLALGEGDFVEGQVGDAPVERAGLLAELFQFGRPGLRPLAFSGEVPDCEGRESDGGDRNGSEETSVPAHGFFSFSGFRCLWMGTRW